MSGTGSSSGRAARAVAISMLALCAAGADAQNAKIDRTHEGELLTIRRKGLERIAKGDPWVDVQLELEHALEGRNITPTYADIKELIAAIRAAAERVPALPADSKDATPQELVTLLQESRIINENLREGVLISDPLHTHFGSRNERKMHWTTLGEVPEHENSDPMIRIYKRGREMAPFLIQSLDDHTATRSMILQAGNNSAVTVYKVCDLALAILEAVTRCKFCVFASGKQFSMMETEFRRQTRQNAQDWWEATADLPPIEARMWLIAKVPYDQAKPMLDLLNIEGESHRAIDLLRGFLKAGDSTLSARVATDMAALGDMTGVDLIVRQADEQKNISANEARLLILHGGPRAIRLLQSLLVFDRNAATQQTQEMTREILRVIAADWRQRPAVIPLLAVLLNPEDAVTIGNGYPADVEFNSAMTRAEMATAMLQQLVRQSFRFDKDAEKEFRKAAVTRAREWWEREGAGLYGLETADIRQRGRIR